MKSRKTEANMTGLSKLVFSLCNLLCCVDWGDTASRVFIIPQFCKHFQWGSPNLSKALLHLQLCKYFLNEKFFEMLRKVCGGSNLCTVLLLWGIYIKKCISPVRIRLRVKKPRNASTKFRKTSESENSPNPLWRIGAGEISRNLPFSRFSSSGSKLTCHHVSTGHFRCQICVIQFRCTRRIDFSRGKSGLAKPCV